MVGPPGLEPGTSPLSGARSDQLSYGPKALGAVARSPWAASHLSPPGGRLRAVKHAVRRIPPLASRFSIDTGLSSPHRAQSLPRAGLVIGGPLSPRLHAPEGARSVSRGAKRHTSRRGLPQAEARFGRCSKACGLYHGQCGGLTAMTRLAGCSPSRGGGTSRLLPRAFCALVREPAHLRFTPWRREDPVP